MKKLIVSSVVVLFAMLVGNAQAALIKDGDYFQYYEAFGEYVTMTGGTIQENLYLKQGSYGDIYGGYIGNFLVVEQTSGASMYGGHIVSGISSQQQGHFNWYGGTIDGEIRSGWNVGPTEPEHACYHKIYGRDFMIDGIGIGDIILTNTKDKIDSSNGYGNYYTSGRLTGFLADGTAINNNYRIYGNSTIELVVIPEPATLLLLGLGCLLLRKK